MLAFSLSLFLFAFWTVIGFAVLAVLYRQNDALRSSLLAPAVGMATTLLPVFWLNRLGLGVGQFSLVLTIVLAIASAGIFWILRPKFPWRDYSLFGLIFLVALLLTGRPIFEFGFDWVSVANPDMTTYYALAAQRLHDFGFYQSPPELTTTFHADFLAWHLHDRGHRAGSDLLLSWVVGITRLMPTLIFMPVILTFHLVLISSTGALVLQSKNFRYAALWTCGILGISALTTLGTLFQLAAQVCGLGLLAASSTLLLRPITGVNHSNVLRYCGLTAIVVAGLMLSYPEVAPFLGLSAFLYVAIGLFQKKLGVFPILTGWGILILMLLLGLNTYLLDVVRFFHSTTSEKVLSSVSAQDLQFPFFLLPSGLADFWGLQGIGSSPPEPWLSFNILMGSLLLVTATIATLWLLRMGQPVAVMTATMLPFGLLLFVRQNDFGTFKLAMFIQPFIISTMVIAVSQKLRQVVVIAVPLLVACILNLFVQHNYVQISRGEGQNGFLGIPNASPSRLYQELDQSVSNNPANHLMFDSSNISLTGLSLLYSRNKAVTTIGFADPMLTLKSKENLRTFSMHDPEDDRFSNTFLKSRRLDNLQRSISSQEDATLIADTPRQGLFNRWHLATRLANVVSIPFRQVSNHLVFIPSNLGQHYFAFANVESLKSRSLFQLESDFFFHNSTIAGIGRHLLFEVLNPSNQPRLLLNMTASLKSDGENQLPPAAAIGNNRENFPIVGRGSARVFSPPLSPQMIDGKPYLAIDMGVDGQTFSVPRTGLMRLYSLDVKVDNRNLVGFGRDISLISSQEYETLTPPQSIKTFPDDLNNRSLEYSGVYEDGWVSEAAFFGLMQQSTSNLLSIKGTVPGMEDANFTTELQVFIDGEEVEKHSLQPGDFNLNYPLPVGAKRRRLDLRFSRWQNLPNPDKRPVAAKLAFVGFSNEKN